MNDVLLYLYITANGIIFLVYGADKFKAIRNQWRISEKRLILCALIGPFGATAGMLFLRHKIKKRKFVILVPLFLMLHLILYFFIINQWLQSVAFK